MIKTILGALLALFALPLSAQTTTITATQIQNLAQQPLAKGYFELTPIDSNGRPTAFTACGGGQVVPTTYSWPVVNGAISGVVVPDTSCTNPSNVGYLVVIANQNKAPIIQYPQPIHPTGTTWSFDDWSPTSTAQASPANVVQSSTVAPTGPCTAPSLFYYGTSGQPKTLVPCDGGTWGSFAGTGGGGGAQADWNASSGPSQILNKPSLGTAATHAATDFDSSGAAAAAEGASESYADGLATNYDPSGTASSAIVALPAAARSGSYTDLTNKPVIPGTITLENVYSAPGSFTFAHSLNSQFPIVNCYTRVGGGYGTATYSVQPVDANSTTVTVPGAGDYICSFSATPALAPDFSVATAPSTLLYEPTMTGTQTTSAYTNTQTAMNGYSGTVTYSASGLPSGVTANAFSPTTITGSGSNTVTLHFPANQAPATSSFTVQGTDGTKTHTTSPSITVGNINQGLVECWAMTDGSGSSLADSCGTSNTETLHTGSLTWASNAGLPGSTATFSSTAYATGANFTATNFDGSTPFSISLWPKFSDLSSFHALVSNLNSSTVGFDLVTFSSGNHLQMGFYNSPTSIVVYSPNSSIATNTLYNIVVTYDGSKTAAGVKLYINGVPQTTTVISNTLTGSIASGIPVALGGRADGTLPLNGLLAYTRIYNRVLSSTDVANYYAAGAR